MASETLKPGRNVALDLVRTTEAAAVAAAAWMGRGDKIGADGAAVDAMRSVLSGVDMDGVVVIGEGEKDEAPMLFNGEQLGTRNGPLTDIAVDLGFGHLGRFSGHYRKLYGESPSTTLRSACGSS